jgi:5-methylcytosine-specific restriction enzyme A
MEPLCWMCKEQGRTTLATIADHVERHNGNEQAFFNGRLRSLCKPHHDGAKQQMERTGVRRGCDVSGIPFGVAGW